MNYKPLIFLAALISYITGLQLIIHNEAWYQVFVGFGGSCVWAVVMVKIWSTNILEKSDIINITIKDDKITNVKINNNNIKFNDTKA